MERYQQQVVGAHRQEFGATPRGSSTSSQIQGKLGGYVVSEGGRKVSAERYIEQTDLPVFIQSGVTEREVVNRDVTESLLNAGAEKPLESGPLSSSQPDDHLAAPHSSEHYIDSRDNAEVCKSGWRYVRQSESPGESEQLVIGGGGIIRNQQHQHIDKSSELLRKLLYVKRQLECIPVEKSSINNKKAGIVKGAMGLTGGVCGSLYFFGMAGTSPTPLGEVALWGSLTGTALLHGGKTFKTILDVSEQWPDFQKKNSVDKAKVVCKEVGASLIPFFGSLPESVLAYFGIYYRTGNVPLALIAACLSSAVRTNTFTALSKEMVGTLSESRMKALYGMTDNDIRLLIKKSNELNKLLIKAFDEEESAGVKARDRQMVVSEVDQLIGDRRLMRDIAKVIKHMAEKDSEVTVVDVREILKSSNVFARFSGAGKFSVTLISAVSIFMLTAEFMAARCLVSSASGDHFRLNDTSLFNQTAIDSYDNNFDCINYSQDVSFAWNTVCNIFGYGGAVSATILGQSLLSIINKAAKGVDNLYVALCDNDFIKEIQDVIFENWKIKLPAFMVSVALALCYRTMASSNLEYLEKLRDLEDCDIDGFGSYLPSIPKGGPIIVNAAFFTSFALYFIPLMMIFGLVSRACGKDHELHDGFSDELEEAVQDEVV